MASPWEARVSLSFMSQLSDADRLQAALTRRFLLPALPALQAFFLALRAEADLALAGELGERYGRPYPYGCCLEITDEVLRRLNVSDNWPDLPGARAVKAFVKRGGEGKMVWGVLRDSYFQNALQLGSLYVDVSNDTVDVRKPKIEIMPMRDAGFEALRDGAHFARIAEAYWKVRVYTNTALPSLAPAFPIIAVDGDGSAGLMAKMSCVVSLFAADGFQAAEQWLREGPPPPLAVVKALRAACSEEVLAADPEVGVEASVRACERLRAAGTIVDEAWTMNAYALFDRAPIVRIEMRSPPIILDKRRANSHPWTGLSGAESRKFNHLDFRS